jgi:hypothetical protein
MQALVNSDEVGAVLGGVSLGGFSRMVSNKNAMQFWQQEKVLLVNTN